MKVSNDAARWKLLSSARLTSPCYFAGNLEEINIELPPLLDEEDD